MATPQGNFTAYQQLKPTELKVGDIYNKAIDELIKNNQAQQAAALKQKMQQNQSLDKLIYDIGDTINGEIKTTSALTNFASDYTKQTGDRYGELMYNASLTSDPAEKQRYLQEALRLKNQYNAIKSSLQSVDYDNIANQDNQNLAKGQVWAGDDKIHTRTLFASGALKPTRGEDGNFYVAVPKGANAKPNDPAEMVPITEFFSRYYGNALEVDISKNFLDDVAKDGMRARDSKLYETRKDRSGQLHSVRALSDKDRNGILDKYFNMEEDKFDVKKVPRDIYQLFYNKYGRYMENYNDYFKTRGIVDEYMKTAVPIDTKDKQVVNTVVNVRNFTSSGDKATIESLRKITSGNIYVKYKDGNVFRHNSATLPATKGSDGHYNPTISVLFDKNAGIFRYYKTFQNKTQKQSIGEEVERRLALDITGNNIKSSASSEDVLSGLEAKASGLKGGKVLIQNGTVDMNRDERKSGGGLFGK